MINKIIFFGNWGAGSKALKGLIDNNFHIAFVCTQYDKNSTDEYYNQVHDIAIENKIPVLSSYRDLMKLDLDLSEYVGVSVAYNEIFKQDILDQMKIINIHASILPCYRGASPILWAIKNHDIEIGVTAHYIDENIDAGKIIYQEKYEINYSSIFDIVLEYLNDCIVQVLLNALNGRIQVFDPVSKEDYYPRLNIPKSYYKKSVEDIYEYLNRKRIQVFTGNRAEFGILLPFVLKSLDYYRVELIVSGSHILEGWNTIDEIKSKLQGRDIVIKTIPIPKSAKYLSMNKNKMSYLSSFSEIFENYFKGEYSSLKLDKPQFSVMLGDRIESLGFAFASFFVNIPVVHIAGGDVANVPYFDTNIRHAISKISHIHFPTNAQSAKVLEQLGEEPWRIKFLGHFSLDYDKMGLLVSKEYLCEKYKLKSKRLIIVTLHPDHSISSEENLERFKAVIETLEDLSAQYEFDTIITSPNNDPGFEHMLSYINDLRETNIYNFKIVNNLGSIDYMSLMKNFEVLLIGNSSSGLIETPYFLIPTINIGNRQIDRPRASNVVDVGNTKSEIMEKAHMIMDDYNAFVDSFKNEQYLFGAGNTSEKAIEFLQNCFSEKSDDEILYKKFITMER